MGPFKSLRGLVPLAFLLLSSHSIFAAAAGPATQIAIAAGNNQTAPSGTRVPGVVCVIATDANNAPVSGVSITWGAITGGGSLVGATENTDASGIATLGGWILGPTAGIEHHYRDQRRIEFSHVHSHGHGYIAY